jgi:hypothetical protein
VSEHVKNKMKCAESAAGTVTVPDRELTLSWLSACWYCGSLRNSQFLQALCSLHAKHTCRRSCRTGRRYWYSEECLLTPRGGGADRRHRPYLNAEQNLRSICEKLTAAACSSNTVTRQRTPDVRDVTLRRWVSGFRRFERTWRTVKGHEFHLRFYEECKLICSYSYWKHTEFPCCTFNTHYYTLCAAH